MTCKVCSGRGYSPFCSHCLKAGKGPRPSYRDKVQEMFDERMKLIESERKRLAKPPGLNRGIPTAVTTYLVEFVVLDKLDRFVQVYGRGFKRKALDHAVEIEGSLVPVLVPHMQTETV